MTEEEKNQTEQKSLGVRFLGGLGNFAKGTYNLSKTLVTSPFDGRSAVKDVAEGVSDALPGIQAALQTTGSRILDKGGDKLADFASRANLVGQAAEYISGGKYQAPELSTDLYQKGAMTLEEMSLKNREQSRANFADRPVDIRPFSEKLADPQFVFRDLIGQGGASLVPVVGAGAVGTAMGGPVAGGAAAFGMGAAIEGGAARNDAEDWLRAQEDQPYLQALADDPEYLDNIMKVTGITAGALEAIPITRLFGRAVAAKIEGNLLQQFLRGFLQFGARSGKQGFEEGSTEALQQIVGNAVAQTYDTNRSLFDGVDEAAVGGFLLGGGTSVFTDAGQGVQTRMQELKDAGVNFQGGYVGGNPFETVGQDYTDWALQNEAARKDLQRIARKAKTLEGSALEGYLATERRMFNEKYTQRFLTERSKALTEDKKVNSASLAVLGEKGVQLNDLSAIETIDTTPAPSTRVRTDEQIAIDKNTAPTEAAKIAYLRDGEVISQTSEDIALRNRIREQVQIANEIFNQGRFAERAKITEALKQTQADIADIKKNIQQYATDLIPVRERGKFITMIRDAKTQRDLTKAFARINEANDQIRQKEIIKSIAKKAEKIANSPSIDVTYKNRANDLLSEFTTKDASKTRLNRLVKLRNFVDSERAAGRDITVPQKQLDALEILNKKPMDQMNITELNQIKSTLDSLENLGKTKLRTRENLYDIEKNKIKDALIKEAKPIERAGQIERKPGIDPKLSLREKAMNVMRATWDIQKNMGLSIMPMDSLFDMIGNSQGNFDSAHNVQFKGRMDADFTRYQESKFDMVGKIADKSKELKMNEQNFENIGIYAALQQATGREKLINTGYTEAELNAKSTLTKDEMTIYEMMREELDALGDKVAYVLEKDYNKKLGKYENYFPMLSDFEKMHQTPIEDRFGDTVSQFGSESRPPTDKAKTGVSKGFTIARKGAGKQKIKVNAFDIFQQHVDNATYFVHMGRDIKMLAEIVNTNEYKDAVGSFGHDAVSQWIDLMARKGGDNGDVAQQWEDVLRKNVGAAILGFRLSTIMVQPTALFDGGTMIGRYAFTGLNDFVMSGANRKFVIENMPEIKERVGGDPAFLDYGSDSFLDKLQSTSFVPMQTVDRITASGVALGAYKQYLNNRNIPFDRDNVNQDAVQYAQRVVRLTQSTSNFKDVPLALSRGGIKRKAGGDTPLFGSKRMAKWLFQFQSFMLTRWDRIYYSGVKNGLVKGVTKGDVAAFGKGVNVFAFLAMAYVSEYYLRLASKEILSLVGGQVAAALGFEDDEDGREDNKKPTAVDSVANMLNEDYNHQEQQFMSAMLNQGVSSVPYLGTLMTTATYNSNPVPVLNSAGKVAEGFGRVLTGQKDSTKQKGLIDMMAGVGSLMGIPLTLQTAQVFKEMVSDDGTSTVTPTPVGKSRSLRGNQPASSGSRKI